MGILKKNWLYLVFIVLSILLPAIWITKNYTYMSEEDNFANYQNVIYKNTFSWGTKINEGNAVSPNSDLSIIPTGDFFYFLSTLHVPSYWIQRIYLSAILFFTFIFFSLFLKLFVSDNAIILAGTLFYYLNFYTKSTVFYSAKMLQLILLPLFFLFMFRYLETKQTRYTIYNFLCLFFTQAIFTNMANAIPTLGIYLLAVFLFCIKHKVSATKFLREFTLKLGLFFLFLLPILFRVFLSYYFLYFRDNSFTALRTNNAFTALTSFISLVFQFRGAWWEAESYQGASYNPWAWFYGHPLIIIISFVFIIIITVPFLKKKADKVYVFWFIVFLLSVLLTSGSSFIPALYRWLFNHIPLFFIFREPWAKFMPLTVFSFSVLLALSLKIFKKHYFTYFVLIIILIRGFPFFSSNFFVHDTKRWFAPFIKLPEYWKGYQSWSINNRNTTMLSIPINYFKRNWYKENIGNANHPIATLFGYTNILYNFPNNSFGSLIQYFIDQNNPNFVKIANIDYSLVQKDIATGETDYSSAQKAFDNSLRSYFSDQPEFTFGHKLFVYPILPQYKLLRIYSADNAALVDHPNDLLNAVSQPSFGQQSALFLKNQNLSNIYSLEKELAPLNNVDNNTRIDYLMINPSKYIVNLHHAAKKTLLIFAQNYHPDWKIFGSSNDIAAIDVPHFVANGYANSWFLDEPTVCQENKCTRNTDGTYNTTFVIEYWPQKLFSLSWTLSLLTIAGSLCYLIWNRIKCKN